MKREENDHTVRWKIKRKKKKKKGNFVNRRLRNEVTILNFPFRILDPEGTKVYVHQGLNFKVEC